MLRNWMLVVSAIVVTAGMSVLTVNPASASSTDAEAAYSPGTATAYTPHYSADTGGYSYHCNFAHWRSGAKVTWHCDLHERWMNEGGWLEDALIVPHSGSWTPGSSSKTTATWLRRLTGGQGQLCTVAYGLSADGGVTQTRCN
jgi:hypothetical protein